MRYSPFSPHEPVVGNRSDSNAAFFQMVTKAAKRDSLQGAILLVGANDTRALALRRAQALLRFDRRVSDWSHAALVIDWPADPALAAGVEVSLDPEDPALQVPERNGVTLFQLRRYFDEKRYTNVAVIALAFEARAAGSSTEPGAVRAETQSPPERRLAALRAAVSPNRDRVRFPLWESLAPWARYAYAADRTTNPLLESVPMPSAALCEYAYEAAGVDLTPGATANQNCPEMIHATMKYWAEGLVEAEGVSVRVFSIVRDESGVHPPALSKDIDEVKLPRSSAGRQRQPKRPGTARKRKQRG